MNGSKSIFKKCSYSTQKGSDSSRSHQGQDTETAMAILKHTPKAACEYLEKLLKSAIANAENNFGMDRDNLYVSECFVCPGPIMKRIMPRAQGRAFRILKRTSHVTLVVKEKE